MINQLTRSIKKLDLKRRFKNVVGPARKRYYDDDFNWDTYTEAKYRPQLYRLDEKYDLQVDERVYFDPNAKKLITGDARLHPNSQTIYEVVGLLGAKCVMEVGCGGGDHLRNLKKIYPEVDVRGADRSTEQLRLLHSRNPEIAHCTFLQDITMPFSHRWPKADLVYSQTVIMHIKTAVSHLSALANMFNLAERYVVLMENFGCHPFVDDIRKLHAEGHINWDNVHFHVHHHQGRPHCLVVTKEPCSLPPLTDYFQLPFATKKRY